MAQSSGTTTTLPTGDLWGRLPREIRDDIYKLTYTADSPLRITMLRAYHYEVDVAHVTPDIAALALRLASPRVTKVTELIPRDNVFEASRTQTFLRLQDFLVSKQWQVEALATFGGGNDFDFASAQPMLDFINLHQSIQESISNITCTFWLDAVDAPPIADLLNGCPKLTKVSLRWNCEKMHGKMLYHRMEWLHKIPGLPGIPSKDFVSKRAVQDIGRLRGLTLFEIHTFGGWGTLDCGEGWASVARELEQEFREVVYRPRDGERD